MRQGHHAYWFISRGTTVLPHASHLAATVYICNTGNIAASNDRNGPSRNPGSIISASRHLHPIGKMARGFHVSRPLTATLNNWIIRGVHGIFEACVLYSPCMLLVIQCRNWPWTLHWAVCPPSCGFGELSQIRFRVRPREQAHILRNESAQLGVMALESTFNRVFLLFKLLSILDFPR
jgi:hypothetical protein